MLPAGNQEVDCRCRFPRQRPFGVVTPCSSCMYVTMLTANTLLASKVVDTMLMVGRGGPRTRIRALIPRHRQPSRGWIRGSTSPRGQQARSALLLPSLSPVNGVVGQNVGYHVVYRSKLLIGYERGCAARYSLFMILIGSSLVKPNSRFGTGPQ